MKQVEIFFNFIADYSQRCFRLLEIINAHLSFWTTTKKYHILGCHCRR